MTAQQPAEDDYKFLPLAKAADPGEGTFRHYVGRWWVVHPDKGLAFHNPVQWTGRRRHEGLGAPLCNGSEQIQRGMAEALAQNAGWPAEAVLVESAWVPVPDGGDR